MHTDTFGGLRSLRCSTASARSCRRTRAASRGHDAREVDRRLDAGLPPPITATRLPLNSGPSQCGRRPRPFIAVLLSPARSSSASARRWRSRLALTQSRAIQLPSISRRRRRLAGTSLGALQVHDVHVIVAHGCSAPAPGRQPGASVSFTEMKFSMPMRVQHLAAEAFGDDAGADALARGVDRRRGAGEPVRRRSARRGAFVLELFGGTRRTGVESAGSRTSMRPEAERLAVQEHGGHGHDLACLDLGLEQRRRRSDVLDARVDDRHERSVPAPRPGSSGRRENRSRRRSRRRSERLDESITSSPDLRADGRRPASRARHQRGEFMAERHAGETQRDDRCRRGGSGE